MEVQYHFNRGTVGCDELDLAALVKFTTFLEVKDQDGVEIAIVGGKENSGIHAISSEGIRWPLKRLRFQNIFQRRMCRRN
jgi:hypothetical protein